MPDIDSLAFVLVLIGLALAVAVGVFAFLWNLAKELEEMSKYEDL